MRKIFIDVGGSVGQTIKEVLNPTYYFDIIYSLEPQRECYEILRRDFNAYLGERLVVYNFGLADFNGEKNLYGTGFGASLFFDKKDIDNRQFEQCRFVEASSFFKDHIIKGDLVVMKLNCEGGEIPILRNLIQSGYIHSLAHILIHFDIGKVPSKIQEEKNIRSELDAVGFKNYVTHREIRWGFTYAERISSWLSLLANAEEIMELTMSQKIARNLPFVLRSRICKMIKKSKKGFYNLSRNYPR